MALLMGHMYQELHGNMSLCMVCFASYTLAQHVQSVTQDQTSGAHECWTQHSLAQRKQLHVFAPCALMYTWVACQEQKGKRGAVGGFVLWANCMCNPIHGMSAIGIAHMPRVRVGHHQGRY